MSKSKHIAHRPGRVEHGVAIRHYEHMRYFVAYPANGTTMIKPNESGADGLNIGGAVGGVDADAG